MDIEYNTPLSSLTVGQLMDLLSQARQPRTVRGIGGIASIFGVSTATAKRIKASGAIDRAITQHGRVIITDVDEALRLYSNRKRKV